MPFTTFVFTVLSPYSNLSFVYIYIFVTQILSEPLSIIIKRYFVPIFGLCIAVRCGTGPEKDLAETVLCESVLQLGEISEHERDDLIKKHMVCFPIRTSLYLHMLFDVPLPLYSILSISFNTSPISNKPFESAKFGYMCCIIYRRHWCGWFRFLFFLLIMALCCCEWLDAFVGCMYQRCSQPKMGNK